MKYQSSRRQFLQTSAAVAGVGYWIFAGHTPKASASPNERIAFAGIGVGGAGVGGSSGKGESDIANAARFADIVALCDTDPTRLDNALKKYPKAKIYTDFRKLFEEQEKTIDAATISTPDHMHAPIGLMAMRMKKHVYVQKPLARTMYECRLMAKVAKETGVCTQMGNQRSATDSLRRDAAEIKAGVYGDVKELHVWTDRPLGWWSQGPETIRTINGYIKSIHKEGNTATTSKVEDMIKIATEQVTGFDWNLWLGVAKHREFFPGVGNGIPNRIYHPFGWRGWWDFGTGALGDIACHSLNVFMKALDLSAPVSVVARTTGHDFDVFPKSSEIVFEYPDTPIRKGFKFVWYDGGLTPSNELLVEHGLTIPERMPKGGDILIGSEGVRGMRFTKKKEGFTVPDVQLAPRYPNADGSIPDDTDAEQNEDIRNMFELITAIKENNPDRCFSNFPNQAGPLTEAMLLGNLAVWTASTPNEWGEKVLWDSKNMQITNLADLKTPGVADLIKPVYPQGYTLD